MSGFDNMRRTDDHIAQNRQFYDAQRYQSDRATAGIIGSIPGQVQQAQMNQQGMEQQQLQSALMEKQVESDLRMQEAVMEQQFHRNKLNDMLMMDQVAMSHENVVAARVQNQATQLELKQRQQSMQDQNVNRSDQMHMKMLQSMGPSGFATAFGKIPSVDPETGHFSLKDASQSELDKFIKDTSRSQSGGREAYINADGARNMAQYLAKKNTPIPGMPPQWPDTPEGQRDKQLHDMLVSGAANQYAGLYGQQHPQGADPGVPMDDRQYGTPQPGPAAQPQPLSPGEEAFGIEEFNQIKAGEVDPEMPGMTPQVKQQANAAYGYAMRDPEWQTMIETIGQKDSMRMMAGIGLAAADLIKNKRMPADRAAQMVMGSIMQGGSEGAYYMTLANYSDDQIRAWLMTRPDHTKSSVEAIMKRLDQHIAKRRKERNR